MRIVIVMLSLLLSSAASAAPSVLLQGADLYTISHGTITRGEMLISEGKIVALGTSVVAPADAQRIDLTGKRIYPGYVAANSVMGLVEVQAVRATVDVAEADAITPNARAEVAINPDSELFAVARANGVLSVLVSPEAGRDGLISGQSALIKMDGWTWEQMTLQSAVAVNLYWPSARIPEWMPAEAVEKAKEEAKKKLVLLDQAWRDASAYRSAKEAGAIKGADLRWEALLPVLQGKRPLLVHASDIVQIRQALDFAQRENIHIIVVGGEDAWRLADTLKKHDTPVILGSAHELPLRRGDSYDAIYAGASKLAQAGVRIAIANSGGGASAANERNLPFQAASYAAFGLGEEAALRAITLTPAELLGVASRLGSLDAGKDATFFVSSGPALDIRSRVERAWIQGREMDLSNKQTRLYEKYQSKYSGQPKH